MDTLVPNPDGCCKFEPNAFKKEKCKNCGRAWNEHKGAITEEQVKSFLHKKQMILAEKTQKELAAKENAKAKAVAKKKANQAVEDEWFFDDDAAPVDVDSDNDMGFRMFAANELDAAPITKPQRGSAPNPLKVVNLIDFGECDVPEEPTLQGGHPTGEQAQSSAPGAASQGMQKVPSGGHAQDAGSSFAPRVPAAGGLVSMEGGPPTNCNSAAARLEVDRNDLALSTTGPSPQLRPVQRRDSEAHAGQEEDLMDEIEQLRQMLADANEEKIIQVAIVQDEVAEKQKCIEELKVKHAEELEAALREARGQVEAMKLAEHERAEVERLRSEVDQHRTNDERHRVEFVRQRKEVEQQRTEIEQHRQESELLRKEVEQWRTHAEKRLVDADQQRKEAECQRAEAEQLRAEVEQLRGALTEAPGPAAAHAAAPVGPLIAEIRGLCLQTRDVLGAGPAPGAADVVDGAGARDKDDIEAELRDIVGVASASHAAAQQVQSVRRILNARVQELEGAVQVPSPGSGSSTPKRAGPGECPAQRRPGNTTEEAVQVMGRHAAQALKAIRLDAERQLAWINKRMRTNHPAELGGASGTPQMDAVGGGC